MYFQAKKWQKIGKCGNRKQLHFHTDYGSTHRTINPILGDVFFASAWPAGTVAVSVWKWMAEVHQTTWLLRLKFGCFQK